MEEINIVNQAVNKLAVIIKQKEAVLKRKGTIIKQLQTQMQKNENAVWFRVKKENEKLKKQLNDCQSTIAVLAAESNALLKENKKLKEEIKKANEEKKEAAEKKVVLSSDTAQTSDIGNAKIAISKDEAKEEENIAKESDDAEDVEMRDNSQQPTVNSNDCDSTNLAIDADQESKKKKQTKEMKENQL